MAHCIMPRWLATTSGASTPDVSVRRVIDRLKELGATGVEEVSGVEETVEFTLPVELR